MLRFKKLLIKNFMSVGEIPQAIDFNNNDITLILGENLDMITDNQTVARNGAGKSALLSALSFALYGVAIGNIKKDRLVNYINEKGMFVVLEFEKDGIEYKIERGRKPNLFKFYVGEHEYTDGTTELSDESQGEGKDTQEEIEKVIGMSHMLFKHILVLNTNTEPFLKLPAKQQRDFIEELLGMRTLGEKADSLRELLKITRKEIEMEDFRISTLNDSNSKIETNISDMVRRSEIWEEDTAEKITQIKEAIEQFSNINIEEELAAHKVNAAIKELEGQVRVLNKESNSITREINITNRDIEKNSGDLTKFLESKCPTCGHDVDSEDHNHVIDSLARKIEKDSSRLDELEEENKLITDSLDPIVSDLESLGDYQDTFYESIEEAYNHQSSIKILEADLKSLSEQTNPYIEQIESMRSNAIQEVSYDELNQLHKIKEHQEFLLKLLSNNDSFIRKKIIDQNIAFLNDRLGQYLESLGLPHHVSFQNDLTVTITNFGRELDFENLSRGESTRLILALSWSFRDIFEITNHAISAIIIDELLDIGSDNQLVEGAMNVIKKMHHERGKDVWIISHKDELQSKIPNVLKIVKEGGFSSFHFDDDYTV